MLLRLYRRFGWLDHLGSITTFASLPIQVPLLMIGGSRDGCIDTKIYDLPFGMCHCSVLASIRYTQLTTRLALAQTRATRALYVSTMLATLYITRSPMKPTVPLASGYWSRAIDVDRPAIEVSVPLQSLQYNTIQE
jgi:hypothetical protein